MRAEYASFIVPVYSSVSSQPPYEIHLPVNTALVLFSWSSTVSYLVVEVKTFSIPNLFLSGATLFRKTERNFCQEFLSFYVQKEDVMNFQC